MGWESHRLPEIKHDNILQSQKWRLEDWRANGMSLIIPIWLRLKLQLSIRLVIVSVSQTDR